MDGWGHMGLWLKEEAPRSGGGAAQSPPPQSRDLACGPWHHPPLNSVGLPYRRHFPWNLILLTIFVSNLEWLDRCQWRMEGGGGEDGL